MKQSPVQFFFKIFNMVDINALEKNVQSTLEIVNTRKHDMILIKKDNCFNLILLHGTIEKGLDHACCI